ncbi:MAG: amidohydrolase family protein [Chloroflexi bacterium]|nr:amidohydrolase family protein [Chloroflexota bacterium]
MTDGAAPIDLLVIRGVLITVDANRRIFLDGAVAVDGGRIVDVGRTDDLRRRYAPDRVIDAQGGVITPGFIDAHTHVSQHPGARLNPGLMARGARARPMVAVLDEPDT